jgi:hypothetical protein
MWILLAQENATFLRENGLFTSAGQWAETMDGSLFVATGDEEGGLAVENSTKKLWSAKIRPVWFVVSLAILTMTNSALQCSACVRRRIDTWSPWNVCMLVVFRGFGRPHHDGLGSAMFCACEKEKAEIESMGRMDLPVESGENGE